MTPRPTPPEDRSDPSRREALRRAVASGLGIATLSKPSAVAASRIQPIRAAATLEGHWPLAGDARDVSGRGRHAEPRGALDFGASGPLGAPGTAVRFNRLDAWLEVSRDRASRIDSDDFTVALRVRTEEALDHSLGDLMTRFDAGNRRGWSLGFAHGTCTTSQPNFRQLAFGLDGGTTNVWIDRGRPGRSVYTQALAVFNGTLYAGTCEPGEGEAGHVYRYDGDDRWNDCGSPDRCNAVAALAEWRGELYAGVSRYRLAGSSLPESLNQHRGGAIFRYGGGDSWHPCGRLPGAEAIGGLCVFRDRLFASSTFSPGVYRFEGDSRWTSLGDAPGGRRVVALGAFDGHLYGSSYDGGFIFRYDDGTGWSLVGEIPGATQTYAFAVHDDRLHVSTWPKGEVYRLDADGRWSNLGRLGDELEVMGLISYNGCLYGGTLPLAQVYRLDGRAWTPTGQLDTTPDVRYRRAWTMAIYRGALFCGTLPSGRVHALKAGACVTTDRSLAAGWRHVAAVRRGESLELFVDGVSAANVVEPASAGINLENRQPLRIGRGPQGSFRGALADVRFYRGALQVDEIRRLAAMPPSENTP